MSNYNFSKKQNPVSLWLLMETGKGNLLNTMKGSDYDNNASAPEKVKMQVACFLHRELPIRLAHRAVELESVPVMRRSDHVQQV